MAGRVVAGLPVSELNICVDSVGRMPDELDRADVYCQLLGTGVFSRMYRLQGHLPWTTLLSSSQSNRTFSGAAFAMTWRCSDTVLYPLSSFEVYLTMFLWSAWIPKDSASVWPGTTADARGTTWAC